MAEVALLTEPNTVDITDFFLDHTPRCVWEDLGTYRGACTRKEWGVDIPVPESPRLRVPGVLKVRLEGDEKVSMCFQYGEQKVMMAADKPLSEYSHWIRLVTERIV